MCATIIFLGGGESRGCYGGPLHVAQARHNSERPIACPGSRTPLRRSNTQRLEFAQARVQRVHCRPCLAASDERVADRSYPTLQCFGAAEGLVLFSKQVVEAHLRF
jgi:hypothetical protein